MTNPETLPEKYEHVREKLFKNSMHLLYYFVAMQKISAKPVDNLTNTQLEQIKSAHRYLYEYDMTGNPYLKYKVNNAILDFKDEMINFIMEQRELFKQIKGFEDLFSTDTNEFIQ